MKTMRILLVIVGVAIVAGCEPKEKPAPSVRKPGLPIEGTKAAPRFSIPNLIPGAEDIRLADFQGKVVLLDFWATWCPPCKRELPSLNKLYGDWRERGFSIIGLTVDQESPEQVRAAAKALGLTYPAGLAGPQVQQMFGEIRAIPTKFLLDRKGRVRKYYLGYAEESQLRADIEPLLAE